MFRQLSRFARTQGSRGALVRRFYASQIRAVSCRSAAGSVRWFSGNADGQHPEKHQFKAETKKLLNIVAHSLYTDKEVFIRELISNASDALEKLRFLQATAQVSNVTNEALPLRIRISTDPVAKLFVIEDSGIGMSHDELVDNLGTIAKSGSLAFLEDPALNAKDKANAIIGQFGVGFYSSFVVSDRVEVYTRSHDPVKGQKAFKWVSDGLGEFTVEELEGDAAQAVERGTRIVCHLKGDCEEFANMRTVKQVAQKFSSFVSFPIYVKDASPSASAPVDGSPDLTDAEDNVAPGGEVELNKQEALWLKPNATEEEHTQFYRYLSNASWGQPLYTVVYHTDAPLSIKAALYVPDSPPNRMMSSGNEVGVALHSRRVLVKKAAEGIVPKWLGWVKGVVDCDDLPLNVSRENMQDSRLMDKLSTAIVRRILKFLDDQSRTDAEKYREKFYRSYAYYLKEGLLQDQHAGGKHKEHIMKLLRFETTATGPRELVSLDEYIAQMKPNQQNIYYFCASDRQTAMSSPYMEQFTRKKRSVLLMFEDIDEFVAMNCNTYKGKKLVAIDSSEDDFEPLLEGDEDDKAAEDATKPAALSDEQQKALESYVKGVLGKKVSAVKFSTRLVNSPAVVTGFLSAPIRKMMKSMMAAGGDPAGMGSLPEIPATLELNPSHEVVAALCVLKDTRPDVAQLLLEQLYDNACIAAGILDDPRTMLDRLTNILSVTAKSAMGSEGTATSAGGAVEGEQHEHVRIKVGAEHVTNSGSSSQ